MHTIFHSIKAKITPLFTISQLLTSYILIPFVKNVNKSVKDYKKDRSYKKFCILWLYCRFKYLKIIYLFHNMRLEVPMQHVALCHRHYVCFAKVMKKSIITSAGIDGAKVWKQK